MNLSSKLPVVLILALVGGGAGLQLGRSAIAEINPVHFNGDGKQSTFYADLTPRGSGDAGWNDLSPTPAPIPLGSGCIGCGAYPEEYDPVPDPGLQYVEEVPVASPEPPQFLYAAEPPENVAEAARIKADLERVALYASAPITAEEQAQSVAEDQMLASN